MSTAETVAGIACMPIKVCMLFIPGCMAPVLMRLIAVVLLAGMLSWARATPLKATARDNEPSIEHKDLLEIVIMMTLHDGELQDATVQACTAVHEGELK
ncbi:hypothetical protein GCM10007862_07750 [Dyella lipolytica]|nr:hypothetical protein GCM10007862_07750 [Dyella lipolytica]